MTRRLAFLVVPAVLFLSLFPAAAAGSSTPPPGTQTDSAFAHSAQKYSVSNVLATTQKTSCYTPEVPYPGNQEQLVATLAIP